LDDSRGKRSRHPFRCYQPRKQMIQYAAPVVVKTS
jgi:hypothetical protein